MSNQLIVAISFTAIALSIINFIWDIWERRR